MPSAALPSTPVFPQASAYTPLDEGYDTAALRSTLRTLFKAAFEQKGSYGQHYIYFLSAIDRDFKLGLDVASAALDMPEVERRRQGLRELAPKGKAALSPENLAALEKLPKAMGENPKAILIGQALETLAAHCIPKESSFNEAIARRIAGWPMADRFSHASLRWLIRLRDAQCIGEERFLEFAGPLASRTRERLAGLGHDERLRAMAILSDAGYHHLLSLEHLAEVAGSIPKEKDELGTINYVNLDTYLAGAYVTARALEQVESAAETAKILKQVIQEATQTTANNVDPSAASQEG